MPLLYAPGFTTAVVADIPWTACQHTWRAWDGTEWDLSEGLSGLALQAGTRGLDDPPIIRYSTKSASVAGSLYRGSTYDERDVFWPIKIYSNGGSQAWIDHNRRFRRTLHVNRTGQWVVTQPSGERRSLTVRYTGIADDSYDIDPSLVGTYTPGFNLVAESPFWMGDSISRTFDNKSSQNFYGGDEGGGFGPPYVLSSGTLVSTANINNPGDEPVFPTFRVDGPSTIATVNGVTFPMDLDAGEWVEINCDPTDQVAVDHTGTDRTSEMVGLGNMAEIEPGDPVPLEISMTGTGRVTVSIVPAYLRAM